MFSRLRSAARFAISVSTWRTPSEKFGASRPARWSQPSSRETWSRRLISVR
jgi:hypothetical protein